MFNELYEINTVQVKGKMYGSRQVIILELGIVEDHNDYQEKKSFVLHEWSANAILDALRGAGVNGHQEDKNQFAGAADGIDMSIRL